MSVGGWWWRCEGRGPRKRRHEEEALGWKSRFLEFLPGPRPGIPASQHPSIRGLCTETDPGSGAAAVF